MNVLYDPQTFLRQRVGGISRMFSDLIAALDRDETLGVNPLFPRRWVNSHHARNMLSRQRISVTPDWLPRHFLYGASMLRNLGRMNDIDLVHHTYYSRRFLDFRGSSRVRRVLTVYDMIPELFSGTDEFCGSHLSKAEYLKRSDLIICISHATKRDLLRFHDGLDVPIAVVHNGVGPNFSPSIAPLPAWPREYLLFAGGRNGYKDFKLLPAAIADLKERGLELPVVVVGPPFSAGELHQLHELNVESLFTCLALSDAQLRSAYANATITVHTSRFEGFGMIPLEAMASGSPVVVADASVMPEICGDAASYFTAGDSDSLAHSLESLLTDEAQRLQLKRQGLERAKNFSIRRMAERTAVSYRSIL